MEITQHFQDKYTEKWGVKLQQRTSKLKEYSNVQENCAGKVIFFDEVGTEEFDEKTSRMAKTVLDETTTDRRCMRPRMFTKAKGFDEYDKMQLDKLDVPVSQVMENLRYAANRRMDRVLLEGIMLTNYKGEEGTEAVEIPASNVIAVNYTDVGAAANSNLSLAKLRSLGTKFRENECWHDSDSTDAGDSIVMAVSPAQIQALLREKDIASFDTNNIKALIAGEVDTFLGIKFIQTNSLPTDPVTGYRICPAWVKSKIKFGLWDDFKVKLSIRDDLDEALQLRAKFACGATRLTEDAVFKILCDETK